MPGRQFRRQKKQRRTRAGIRRLVSNKFDNYTFKLRYDTGISSNASGIINLTWTHTKMDGVLNETIGTVLDWPSIITLFDSYRVTHILIQYYPSRPNDAAATTQFEPIYYASDNDSTAALTGISEAVQYSTMKVRNLYMPHTVSYKLPSRFNVTANGVIVQGGYLDMGNVQSTGCVKTFAGGLHPTLEYGHYVITYTIKCKGRR